MNPLNRIRQNLWKLRPRIPPDGGRRDRTQIIAVVLLTIVAFGASPVTEAQANPPSEYELKAVFLFNFAKFIDWPTNSFGGPQAPFTICILGKDPFGRVLDDKLQGKTVGDRHTAVQRLKDKAEGRRCQMLFVSSSESPHLGQIIESLQGANVLLVGETNGFATAGGTIEFTLEASRVRFTINTDAADRAGLKFSAKLLTLAKIVHDEGHLDGG